MSLSRRAVLVATFFAVFAVCVEVGANLSDTELATDPVAVLENSLPYNYMGTNEFRYTTQYDIGTIRFVATRRDGSGKFLGYYQRCRKPVPPLDFISLCSPSGYVFCPLVVTPCDYSRDVTYFFLIDNPVDSHYGLSVFDNQILPVHLEVNGPEVHVPLEFSQTHYYDFNVTADLMGTLVSLLLTPESNATHPIEVYVSNSPTHKNCYKWTSSSDKAAVCSVSLEVGKDGFLPGTYYVAITPMEAPIEPTQFYSLQLTSSSPAVGTLQVSVTNPVTPTVHESSYFSFAPSLLETTMTGISVRNSDKTYLGDTELNVGSSKWVSRQSAKQQCIETDNEGTCNLVLERCERKSTMFATVTPIANYKFDFTIDATVNITETNYTVIPISWDAEYTVSESYTYYRLPSVTGISSKAINLHFYNITNTRVSAIFARNGVSDGGSCMEVKAVCPTRSTECFATQLVCSYRNSTGNLYISLRAPPSILTTPISFKFTASLNNSFPLTSGQVLQRSIFTNEAHIFDLPSNTAPVEFSVTVTENISFPSLQLALLNQSGAGCGFSETASKCQASPQCSITLLCPTLGARQVRVLNLLSLTQSYNVTAAVINPTPLTNSVNLSLAGKRWLSFNLTTPKSFRLNISTISVVTYELFRQCSLIAQGVCTPGTGCAITFTDANLVSAGQYYLSIAAPTANVSIELSFGACSDVAASLTFCKSSLTAPFSFSTWINPSEAELAASTDFDFLDSIYLSNCTETVRKVACASNLRRCDSNKLETAFCEEDCLDLMCQGCFASECAESVCSKFPACGKPRACTFQQRPVPPRPPTPSPLTSPSKRVPSPSRFVAVPESSAREVMVSTFLVLAMFLSI